jgi:hypothetical protein
VIAAGDVIKIKYPFVRDKFVSMNLDEPDTPCWRPGVRFEDSGPDDTEAIADGLGQQVFTVVSIHKPGKFPTRVFYTRNWIDPDGKQFGKGTLKMLSVNPFMRRISGYWHEYKLTEPPSPMPS